MSIAYLDSLRILYERLDPNITNLEVLNIVWQNSTMLAFFELIDQELINFAGVEWFLKHCNAFPNFVLKLIKFGDENALQQIADFICHKWTNIVHIRLYKIAHDMIIQKLPNAFNNYKYVRHHALIMEYKGTTRVLTFGTKSYISETYDMLPCYGDGITCDIVDINNCKMILIKINGECIVQDCINSRFNIQRDDLKIYAQSSMSIDELLTLV